MMCSKYESKLINVEFKHTRLQQVYLYGEQNNNDKKDMGSKIAQRTFYNKHCVCYTTILC